MSTAHQLEAHDITLAYGDRTVVQKLDLSIMPGQITSIVGANGCGKSTLLRALSRLLKPRGGEVTLDERPLGSFQSKALARTLGLLPQSPIAPDGIAVSDLVGRGRHPHQRTMSPWSARDYEAVADALDATGLSDLADRPVDELSGGQRQRVWVAMTLAQQTDILLLDEPTTFLDIAHQIEVLDLLTDLNRRRGTTIVMVLHDLNLAARYSDVLVAMTGGNLAAFGTPAEVINPELIRTVFGIESQVVQDPVSHTPLVVPIGRHHA